MATLLRLAEDLERTRDQSVREAHVAVDDGTVRLELDADGDDRVARWAAEREVELFARAFDRRCRSEGTQRKFGPCGSVGASDPVPPRADRILSGRLAGAAGPGRELERLDRRRRSPRPLDLSSVGSIPSQTCRKAPVPTDRPRGRAARSRAPPPTGSLDRERVHPHRVRREEAADVAIARLGERLGALALGPWSKSTPGSRTPSGRRLPWRPAAPRRRPGRGRRTSAGGRARRRGSGDGAAGREDRVGRGALHLEPLLEPRRRGAPARGP